MANRIARPYHHGDLRNALLLEARLLLEEHGAAGLVLREVAGRARVAAPSAYHHFTNLDGLAAALAEVGFTELNAKLASCPTDVQGRLAPIRKTCVTWARANPG